MANFYAQLKQSIREFDVLFTEPPSYIKHFTNCENNNVSNSERIVMFCNKAASYKTTTKTQTKQPHHEKDDLNLTGSPLKDSCQFDSINEFLDEPIDPLNAWTDLEESFHPIKSTQAQFYFSHIATTYDMKYTTRCWSLCKSDNENILALSMDLKKGNSNKGILKYTGLVPYEPIDLSQLFANHAFYVPMQLGVVEMMVDSYYQLNTDTSDATVTLQVSKVTNGLVKHFTNEVPSKMILHQSIKINNFTSIIFKFWRQICIIDTIKESVINFKETKDPSTLVFNITSEGNLAEIKKEIIALLTEPATLNDIVDGDDDKKSVTFRNINEIIDDANNRDSSELTDQLWTVLRGCSSYEMLKEAIEYIFNSVAKINVVNMPTSQSRLGHLIREVSEHRIAIPHLNGSEPLELLVEIGIEKATKDYEFIFVESKLCSGEELRLDKKLYMENNEPQLNVRKSLKSDLVMNAPISNVPARKTLMHTINEQSGYKIENVGFQNSMFSLVNVEEHLARLGRLHLILEHLFLIQSQLKLDQVYTTFLEDLRKPLIPFHMLKEMRVDTREIPVSNHKILARIENDLPHRQRAVLQSHNRFKFVRNTFFFSKDPIFPPDAFKCIEIDDSQDAKYYSHQYLEIENI